MAAKSKQSYKYVAHVDKGGETVELTGIRENTTMKKVYQFLLQRAAELGGWLLTQQIEEAATEASVECIPKLVCTSQDTVKPAPTFGDSEVFGKFEYKYAGAARMVFKEK